MERHLCNSLADVRVCAKALSQLPNFPQLMNEVTWEQLGMRDNRMSCQK